TIQTVPSHAKSTAYPQPATKSSSKSLYKGRTTTNLDSATSSSSGLDELASAVASSGLASELSKQPGGRVGGDQNGAGRRSGASSRSSSSRGNGNNGQTLAYRTPDAGAKKNNLVLILALSGGGVGVLAVVVLLVYVLMRGSPVAVAPAGGG